MEMVSEKMREGSLRNKVRGGGGKKKATHIERERMDKEIIIIFFNLTTCYSKVVCLQPYYSQLLIQQPVTVT